MAGDRAHELQADAELANLLEEQLLFQDAHPRMSKKDKLPPSGQGSKFRNLAFASELHQLAFDATSDDRLQVIDKVWPR